MFHEGGKGRSPRRILPRVWKRGPDWWWFECVTEETAQETKVETISVVREEKREDARPPCDVMFGSFDIAVSGGEVGDEKVGREIRVGKGSGGCAGLGGGRWRRWLSWRFIHDPCTEIAGTGDWSPYPWSPYPWSRLLDRVLTTSGLPYSIILAGGCSARKSLEQFVQDDDRKYVCGDCRKKGKKVQWLGRGLLQNGLALLEVCHYIIF